MRAVGHGRIISPGRIDSHMNDSVGTATQHIYLLILPDQVDVGAVVVLNRAIA